MPETVIDIASNIQAVAVRLTNAEVKALPTTPITVLPDPGAGRIIVPVAASWETTIVGAYTNVDVGFGELSFYRGDTQLTGIGVGPGTATRMLAAGSDTGGGAITLRADNNGAGNYTGGNAANKATLVVWYSILTAI